MAAGQIGISVFPNTERFHTLLSKEVRDKSKGVKVDIPVDVDAHQIHMLEEEVDQLDGRSIELKVDVKEKEFDDLKKRIKEDLKIDLEMNTQEARETYANFKREIESGHIDAKMRLKVDEEQVRTAARQAGIQEIVVDGVLDLDDSAARRKLEKFQDDFNVIHSWLLIHTDRADDEMYDFRDKHLNRAISQTVKINWEMSPLQLPSQQTQMPDTERARRSMQGLEGDQWNVINMWGKMWDSMNQQIDLGVIRIYDKYRQMVVEAGKFLMKPAQGFMNIVRSAENFQDVSDGINRAMSKFGNLAGDHLLNAASYFEKFTVAAQGAWDKMRPIDDIRLRFMVLGDTISKAAGVARERLGILGGHAADAARRVGGAFRTVGQKIASPFVRAGQAVRSRFNNAILAATFSIARLDMETGGALTKIANGFKATARGITNATKLVGRGITQGLIHPIRSFRTVANATFSGVSKGFSLFMRGFEKVSDAFDWNIVPAHLFLLITEDGANFLKWLGGWGKKAVSGLTWPFRKFGEGVGKIFGSISDKISPHLRKISDSVTNMVREVGDRMNVLGHRIAAPFHRMNAIIGTALAGVQAKTGLIFRAMGDRFGNFMAEGLRNNLRKGMSRVGGTMSDALAKAAGSRVGKAFSGFGRRIGGAMEKSMGDKAAFKAVSAVMRRMNSYVVGFGQIATGAFAKVAKTLMGSLLPALIASAAGMALMAGQVALTAILAIGSAIGQVVQGAALMAPALVAAAGISFAALKFGLEGVGDAVAQAFNAESVEDFEAAMEGLPASVQGVARAFRGFKPAMDEMKSAVQDNLLEGLGPNIEKAMTNLFPLISSGLQDIATEWNGSLKMALDQLATDEASSGLSTIMDNTTEAARNMQPVLANLLRAFGSLAEQGSNWLPQMGEWLTDITESFGDWAEGLKEINEETGVSEFDTKMQNMVESAKLLGAIFGGLGGAIRNVFAAGGEGGGGLMVMMAEGAQALNESTKKGTENYAKMVEYFESAADAASQLGLIIDPLFGIIADIAGVLMEVASGSIPGIGAALEGLESGLQPLKEAAFDFGENLGRGIEGLAPALSRVGDVATPLLAGIGEGLGNLGEAVGPALDSLMAALTPVAEALGPLFGTMGTVLGDIFVSLEPIISSSLGVLEAMAPVLQNIFEWFGTIGTAVIDAMAPLFMGHDESMAKLLDALNPVIDALGNGLLSIIEVLAPYMPIISDALEVIVNVIAALIPLLPPVIDFVMVVLKHAINFLLPIAGVIMGIYGAVKLVTGIMAAFNTIMAVARGIITGVRIAMTIFNLVLSANPIARIITIVIALVGALVYFFTQTELGQKIWEGFTEALKTGWEKFTDALSWTWENIIQPVWEGIKTAAAILFAVVMTILITPLILAWNTLSWAIQGAWENILKPAWEAIQNFARRMWEENLKPDFERISNGWDIMVHWIGVGWDVIKRIWDTMIFEIRRLWAENVQPILDNISNKWNEMKDKIAQGWYSIRDNAIIPFTTAITDLWNKYVQPHIDRISNKWNEMKDSLTNTWNNIKQNVFDGFKRSLDTLKEWFHETVDNVGRKWDELKEKMSTPINWAIDKVFNNGIRLAWNAVAGLVKLKELDKAPLIGKFATGGVLPGYTPGRDVHDFRSPTGGRLMLSGGEAIMRPEWTKAVGGPRAVEQMNAAARSGKMKVDPRRGSRVDGIKRGHRHAMGGVVDLGAFAGGGVIPAMINIVSQKYPMLTMTSGFDNRPGYHGRGMATDWSNGSGNTPAQLALAHDIADTYPGSAQLIYDSPGWDRNIYEGSPAGAMDAGVYNTAQAGPHHHHVHWAMTTPPTMPFGGGVFEGGSGGGGGGIWQAITGTVKKLWDAAIDLIPSFPGADSFGEFGKVPGSWLSTAASAAWDFVKSKADTIMELVGGGGGADWTPGAGAEQWREGVIAAFLRQGEEPLTERVDALVRQIHTESKGDPNIAQQIVDVNGTGPSAGLGLYQFIPTTFAAYRDPSLPNDRTNPEAAHNAAVRYFRDRHGWNTGPGGVGRGHGWKDGGVFDSALSQKGYFDLGGMARGTGLLQKNVITPERVLSPTQTRAFNEFVYGFMPELINSYRNRPYDIRNAVSDVIDGWNGIQRKERKENQRWISSMADKRAALFGYYAKGVNKTSTYAEVDQVVARFADRGLNSASPSQLMADGRYLHEWFGRNQANLERNVEGIVRDGMVAARDPHAIVEAEMRARELYDEKFKEETDAERKERDEEIRKTREEEQAARDEKRNEILEGLSEDQKELKQAEFERQDEEIKAREDAEDEARREAQRREDEEITRQKESGEYYYGFKVLNEDGSNPNEPQDTEEVKEAKRYASAAADFAGVSDAYEGVSTRLEVVRSLDSAVKLAAPAWIAALNGDRSALTYNMAAAHAANMDRTMEDAQKMGPSALFGAIEMFASGTSQTAPFIGEVNSGMTPGQLNQTLTHYEAQRARRMRGTTRTR